MADIRAELSVLHMPLLVSLLRREMARLLVAQAAREEPRVAGRLVEIAAAFECGAAPMKDADGC